jgi:hypothetical protein
MRNEWIASISTICFLLGSPLLANPDEMTFTPSWNGGNCVGCEWLQATGVITENTPRRFAEYITNHGTPHFIALHSPGGDLVAGLQLGELIRATGATTWIGQSRPDEFGLEGTELLEPGICASACAFAFMGGRERSIGPLDMLGVHQFFSANGSDLPSTSVQATVGLTLIHTISMGVDPAVIVAASGTSPEEMYWFNEEEIARFGLESGPINLLERRLLA